MSHTAHQRGDFEVVVVASDRGTPSLSSEVLVQMSIVDRANRPPVWDQRVYGPVTVPENISVGQTVYSIKARFVVFTLSQEEGEREQGSASPKTLLLS